MKNFLKDLIADPLNGKQLFEEKINGEDFLSSENNRYLIKEGIPVLLSDKEESENINSGIDRNTNSQFDYRKHYAEDAAFFDYFKKKQSPADKEEIRRLHQVVISHVPKKAEIILDVGCGNGWVAKYFLPKDKKVISMDISITNPARVLKENQNENHAAIVADAYYLPFRKNSIDVIIASEIMEHVNDPKLFITKMLEILKPGGTLIITTPYDEKIEYFMCVHCNKPTPKNAHLHSFNEKNIENFIPEGFNYKTQIFSNRYIVRLRLNLLLSFLPISLWKFKDSITNFILKNPMRFLIEIKK